MRSRTLVLLAAFALLSSPLAATSIATVALEDLYCEADVVAVVGTFAGGSENYTVGLFKAKVLEGFKGVSPGAFVHFGPYGGYEVGGTYLLFLRRSGKTLGDLRKPVADPEASTCYDDAAAYYSIMYAGYSAMAVEYSSTLHTDGVKLSPLQVTLPEHLSVVPLSCDEEPGKAWVRKDALLAFLRTLRDKACAKAPRPA